MRIFVAGVDGYLGWSLATYLAARGHELSGCDIYLRRNWVAEMGSQSATPIRRMTERLKDWKPLETILERTYNSAGAI